MLSKIRFLKYCCALCLLFVSISLCPAQDIRKELLHVKKDIERIGFNIKRVEWNILERNDELTILESKNGNAFLIVVNEEFRKYVSNAIIAYSETNGFQGTESPWKKNLIHVYTEQLRKLRERGRIAEQQSFPFRLDKVYSMDVYPLMQSAWGQDYPYNEHCPASIIETTHNLTGCVATALSQVMYYHRYPTKGSGTFECGNNEGRYVINFEEQLIDWNGMLPTYPQVRTKGVDIEPIARLMALNARAVSSQFNIVNTSANYIAARSILVNHWGYSPSCKFMKNTDIAETCAIIASELNRKQPVLLSGGQHAFVCDGYINGYFHLNLGWRGAANGYYKFLLEEELKDAVMSEELIKEIVFGICPDYSDKSLSKTVDVDSPGTLCHKLSAEEKKHLRKLTITGKLNGQDIALLRRMMGATDSWHTGCVEIDTKGKWTGELQELDIENATFKRDNKQPFLRIKAPEGQVSWGKRTYHIDDSIGSKEFRNLLKTPLSRGKGFRYVQHQEKPFIEFYALPHVISPLMFYDCQNLRQLRVPSGTREILGNAFQWCSSLSSIELPSTVRYVEAGAFRECYLLTHITANSRIVETCHLLFPFKTSGKYGEKDRLFHKGLFEGNNIYTCKGIMHDGEIQRDIKYKVIY